jgi:hypothetical protein
MFLNVLSAWAVRTYGSSVYPCGSVHLARDTCCLSIWENKRKNRSSSYRIFKFPSNMDIMKKGS